MLIKACCTPSCTIHTGLRIRQWDQPLWATFHNNLISKVQKIPKCNIDQDSSKWTRTVCIFTFSKEPRCFLVSSIGIVTCQFWAQKSSMWQRCYYFERPPLSKVCVRWKIIKTVQEITYMKIDLYTIFFNFFLLLLDN